MADIQAAVNAMAKEDTSPTPPATWKQDAELSEMTVKAIAAEMAQPWQYGFSDEVFASRFCTKPHIIRQVRAALDAKQAVDNPVVVTSVK